MQVRGEEKDCQEMEQHAMLAKLNWYLQMMKEYYDTEVRIRNIWQEREKAAR